MAQKAMTAGIALLVAVSVPPAAAIRLVEAVRITLVGFARGERMLVYTHAPALGEHNAAIQYREAQIPIPFVTIHELEKLTGLTGLLRIHRRYRRCALHPICPVNPAKSC